MSELQRQDLGTVTLEEAGWWPKFFALWQREMAAFFLSPMSYLVWAVFLVAAGYLFATSIKDGEPASLNTTFNNMGLLLLFVAPMLTMRLVAEEVKQGTLEVLMTDPVDEAAVILAKYGAACCFFAVLLSPTTAYPLILSRIGQPDLGPLLAGYLGLYLIGALFLAVGLFTSTATGNQIAAAVLSFACLLVLWVLGLAADGLAPGTLRSVLSYLSTYSRFADFRRGLVDTRTLVYCTSLVGFSLFLSVRALGLRRLR